MAVAVLAIVIVLPTLRLAHPRAPQGALGGIAVEVFAIVYLGATTACLGWLLLWPAPPQGLKLLFFYLACIWIGDSAAYYFGRSLGRHKMSPRISPNKTLEGLAATLFGQIKAALGARLVTRAGAALVAPALRQLKGRLDPDTHGGAPLLGVNGVCIIGHGSANSRAVANGIAVAARAVRGNLTGAIAAGVTPSEG